MNHPLEELEPGQPAPAVAVWLAPAAWLATVGLTGLAVGSRVMSGVPPAENRFQFGDASMAAFVVLQVVYVSVGAIVATRRPRHPVGWLLLLVGFLYAVQIVAVAYVSAAVAQRATTGTDAAWAALLADATTFMAGTAFFALIVVFPDGRVPIPGWQHLRRWRWLILALDIPLVVALAVRPGQLWLFPQFQNPMAAPQFAWLAEVPAVPMAFGAVVAVTPVALLALFIARARSARGAERQQIKWFGLSAAIATVTLSVTTFGGLLTPNGSALGELPLTAFLLSASLMPIAIGIAILRYRLYDIDLIIRRTLIYGGLTVALGALYVAFVLVLQGLLASYTTSDTFAVAASTLAVAALFQPARRSLQAVVDRRFYRSRYDAGRTVEAFSARLRDQVDLGLLSEDLRRVTRDTMRPTAVSVWFR